MPKKNIKKQKQKQKTLKITHRPFNKTEIQFTNALDYGKVL